MPHQTADSTGFHAQLRQHLSFLYPDGNEDLLAGNVSAIFDGFDRRVPLPLDEIWSQQDAMLITYGDSVRSTDKRPLQTLAQFLQNRVGSVFSSVHILPFCPYSSDDGFAVIDYTEVDSNLGNWNDISSIAGNYRLMADLVINHAFSESEWFKNYCAGREPGASYFTEANAGDDLSRSFAPEHHRCCARPKHQMD